MARRTSHAEQLKRISSLFEPHDHVLLPIVADPDAIASALALRRILWRKVASSKIVRVNDIKRPDNLTLLRYLRLKLPFFSEVNHLEYNKFALLDGQPAHNELLSGIKFDLILDHHPVLESTSAELVDIRPDYGATATIMTELLKAGKIKPSKTLATALFYAIKTDTDSFSRPSLDEDMKAFRYLFPFVDHNWIRKIESSEIPLSLLRYFRNAFSELMIRGNMGFVYLDRVNHPDTLVMISDFLLHIQALDTTIVGGISDDTLVVVFRNANSRKNAGRMAETAFGNIGRAGGHAAAARAEIPLSKLAEYKILPENNDFGKLIMDIVRGKNLLSQANIKNNNKNPQWNSRK
jgi:nanoRNase/pAp phosphatase (c-di-AMP/oligoRNAs hydrolase)